jgi:hypothetical protein
VQREKEIRHCQPNHLSARWQSGTDPEHRGGRVIQHDDPVVARTGQTIAAILADDIAPLFKPEVKLTFIARTPGHPDRDMVITNDEIREVVKVARRRAAADNRARFAAARTSRGGGT